MNIKKTTVLMAAVLAVATVLTAGLSVLPASVQNAQANPCTDNTIAVAASSEEGGEGDAEQNTEAEGAIECDLTGVVINEKVTTEVQPLTEQEEELAEEAEEAEDAEFE